ncbi:MAG: GIY-YIG nuclease family protein [Candidatus Margulisiibacteriota bacterium]
MWVVYVLRSKLNGRLYIGYTASIKERFTAHNNGKVRSTKAYKPYKVAYMEEFSDKTEARKREIFLKTGKGREFLKSIIDK